MDLDLAGSGLSRSATTESPLSSPLVLVPGGVFAALSSSSSSSLDSSARDAAAAPAAVTLALEAAAGSAGAGWFFFFMLLLGVLEEADEGAYSSSVESSVPAVGGPSTGGGAGAGAGAGGFFFWVVLVGADANPKQASGKLAHNLLGAKPGDYNKECSQ